MKIARILLAAALVTVSACDDGVSRPPPTDVRFFHAAPNFDTLAFLREARGEAILEYAGGAAARFDSGEYDFHLESRLAGTLQAVRELSFKRNLSPDFDYVFVAVAPGGVAQVLEIQLQPFDAASSNARVTVIGAHPSVGPVDIYLQPTGTLLPGVLANGSVSFGNTASTFTVAPQTSHLYLTPAGDPNTILFESVDATFNAGTDTVLVIHATGGQVPSDIGVSRTAGTALPVTELGLGSMLRVVQGIDDRLDRDFVLDGDTATPLFTSQPFGVISSYAPLTAATHTLTLTPAGAPATVERSIDFTPLAGRNYIGAFAGDTTNGIEASVFIENQRRIVRQASLSFLNIAGLYNSLYIYIRPPGTDISTVLPTLEIAAPGIAPRALAPGDYEVTVQDSVTDAILAGPVPITVAAEGIYGILLSNNADSVTVQVDYFYDF